MQKTDVWDDLVKFTVLQNMDIFLLADQSVVFTPVSVMLHLKHIQQTLHIKGYVRSAILCFI